MNQPDVKPAAVDTSTEAVERVASWCDEIYQPEYAALLRALLANTATERAVTEHYAGSVELLRQQIDRLQKELDAARANERRLLEALVGMVEVFAKPHNESLHEVIEARAAIAAQEGKVQAGTNGEKS